MHLRQLWLNNFRTYTDLELELPPGLTCVVGSNGIGKTNLLEAVGYAATLESFRNADSSTMVQLGEPRAIIRAEGAGIGRDVLVEIELGARGRGRVQVNRQRLNRTNDLLDMLRLSVFAPDDLELVKGSPGNRRDLLDRALVSVQPRLDSVRRDLARILKQRNALLRQARGRLDDDAARTLDVFDDRFAAVSETIGAARAQLVADVQPFVQQAYETLAGPSKSVVLTYDPVWMQAGLHAELIAQRREELRRGVSLVGPHRDDLTVELGGLPSRTHASQGEQRSLALALRLGVHLLVADAVGTAPILLLDDVFSELDADRSSALFAALPPGQALLSTAVELPPGAEPELILEASPGEVTPRIG